MSSHWHLLNDRDRDAVRTLRAFLDGRLADRRIVDWALRTRPQEIVKRTAVLESIELLDVMQIKEPWHSAWRLIQESWKHESAHPGIEAYRIRRRIMAGERSSSLISAIISAVQPRLEVSARSEQSKTATPKRPRRVEDLLYASLRSQKLYGLEIYRLDNIGEIDFLITLGIALEGVVNHGIALGRSLGWENDHKFWRLGQLYYVGYRSDQGGYNRDVDGSHTGIAPSVKLLDAVVKRIGVLDPASARVFVSRWKQMLTPVHLRLWASLSQAAELTSVAELGETLSELQDREFWDIHAYPEIAELRALRFDDVAEIVRRKLVARIKKGPPRTFWPRGSDRMRIKSAQQYQAARELRRIEVAGYQLPASASNWLATHLEDFPDLRDMDSVHHGFLYSGMTRWTKSEPDDRFNELVGSERLYALETALKSTNRSWDDDPAERASDWIRSGDNASLVLSELEATPDSGAGFPNIWDRFGWCHAAPNRDVEVTPEHEQTAGRVLALLELLPNATIESAIQGITHWLSSWEHVVKHSPKLLSVWVKLWPIAVASTNESTDENNAIDLNQVVESSPDEEPLDMDTLNTAAGRLVGVFLASCPNLDGNENPFDVSEPLRIMRDSIIAADGKSGLIGRHRLIEGLPYFLQADEEWSKRHLVEPLVANDAQSLALWRAIAHSTQFTKVLKVIGDQFVDRVTDRRLGRETRSSLLSSLVVESLHAFRERRDSVISNAKVQQALRSVDDEVRANAAQMVQRFLSWMVKDTKVQPQWSAEEAFRIAIAPFLRNVWPQERSLATRGVSAAFAELPAAAGEAFSEAVGAIERFLVPFDCWSMSEFGLGRDVDGAPQLALIRTPDAAAALLHLLDLSIGTADGAVIPMDLAEALDQIRLTSPNLVQDPAFRRLSTAARRR